MPKLIRREGPTGLICTTTALALHAENETRHLSLGVTDTREQTSAILAEIARQVPRDAGGLETWHALQIWLAAVSAEVFVPYAKVLAEMIPPVAVRLRRDFSGLLMLVKAHALLHRATRARNDSGTIIATPEDYGAVRALVVDIIAQSVEATVKKHVREIVKAVVVLGGSSDNPIGYVTVAQLLKLDKSTISRHVNEAIEHGFLRNLETKERQPARIVPGDPLPSEQEVLPTTAALLHCCTVSQGVHHPSPPSEDDWRSGRLVFRSE